LLQRESDRLWQKLGVFVGLVAVDVFKDGKAFPFGTLIARPQFLGDAKLILYPPALSFVKLRRLRVDKLGQILVTVLVIEVT